MKRSILILSFICVSVFGPNYVNCGPPVIPPNCGVPDCTIPANKQNHALFPHSDPNKYYQCMPLNARTWASKERKCACGTVFNPNVNPPRCTFYDELGWAPQCGWTDPPQLAECKEWCPECNGNPPQTVAPDPEEVPTQPTTQQAPACNCPCVPCIWWPCMPCNPCAC